MKKKKLKLIAQNQPKETVDEATQVKLISEDQVGKEAEMAKELEEAKAKVQELSNQLDSTLEESVSLQG